MTKPKDIEPIGPARVFEDLMRVDENGLPFWSARDLMEILEYKEWRYFDEVIKKAQEAAQNSNQDTKYHFGASTKMIETGKGGEREVPDYKLSRYACYLVAQNGNPQIRAIAIAQTYFAYQTRKQEIIQAIPDAEKRFHIRGEVLDHNKKLAETATSVGVSDFATFNNSGYLGLYNMSLPDIKKKKGIGSDNLLDRAGSTELAANLFRITQTDEKIKKEREVGKRGQGWANQTHSEVGKKVRQTIKEIGGVMPENLPAHPHLKEIDKEVKKQLGGTIDQHLSP